MKRKRVLLADDDSDQRELLRILLKYEGFDVLMVASGVELLEVLEWSQTPDEFIRIDLIITDLMMPFCTGLEALEVMQARGLQVPVLVASAVADMPVWAHAKRLGARAFLTKPFDRVELRQKIDVALGV